MPLRERLRVIGLDLSLASTGMSDVRSSHVIQTAPDIRREERLEQIVHGVLGFVHQSGEPTAHLAVIEGSSYGSQGRGREELATVRNMVRHMLWSEAVPFLVVAPTALKKFMTGNGNASKNDMVAEVRDQHGVDFGDVPVAKGRYDLADAFSLAVLGYMAAGCRFGPSVNHGVPIYSAVDYDQLALDALIRSVEDGVLV